ncbi:MAG TPA: hypothetical protein VMV81_11740 [Phycisphaerae bacterium]|nr:hypothetical protein [Phycisphaerae bacterium]
MKGISERDIGGIIDGCSPEARQALASMLATAFSTLDHLDMICPVARPPCHEYLRFQELRKLHVALNDSLKNGHQRSQA